MNEYTVRLYRLVEQSTLIKVKAENEDEALDTAAEQDIYCHLYWDDDSVESSGDAEVVDCTPLDEGDE